MLADYTKVYCPRCKSKYFRVKKNYSDDVFDIFPLVLKVSEDPIYKDGVLQNPPKEEATRDYFQCLDCGCNFRVESLKNSFTIIDEDKEKEEREEKLKKSQEEILKNSKETTDIKDEIIKSTVINGNGLVTTDNTATISIKNDYSNSRVTYDAKGVSYKGRNLEEVLDEIFDILAEK